MGNATPGAILGLLMVFLILAILPLILIKRDSLQDKVNEKKCSDLTIALKKIYNETYEATAFCTRCTRNGHTARLKLHRNEEDQSLLLLSCPSCGSAFKVNSELSNL